MRKGGRNSMIDIHSHILPGVDDGAKDEQASLDMARVAIDEGITQIVATPHHKNGNFDNYRDEIITNVAILNELFDVNGLELTVLPGQEVRIYGEVIDDYHHKELQTVNDSKYMLIEFPFSSVPRYADQLFYDMQMEGIQPVIVHPERNKELLNNHEKMYNFIKAGVLSQVTTGSVLGKFGKEIQDFSQQLIESNLTHFVSSDAHNTTSRGFYMRDAYQYIQDEIDPEAAFMFMENAELLIDDQNVYRNEPHRIMKKKKRFFGLF